MRNLCVAVLWMLWCLSSAQASTAIDKYMPNAKLVGNATFSFALWDVYHARLYTSSGVFDEHAPHALTLRYLIEIKGEDIAARSVEEIKQQGFTNESKLSNWHAKMRDIFPDVREGTELTAIFLPRKATYFYQGNQLIGGIEDSEFTKHFSAIWLHQTTSQPQLRKQLLGLL